MNFRMWMANLMRGRYGMDNLNRFLLILALILIIVNMFFGIRILSIIALFLLIYFYCRLVSRNVGARSQENQRYLQLTARFRGSGNVSRRYSNGPGPNAGNYGAQNNYGAQKKAKDKDHKILRCPVCGEKLRVPKGAGKISISCPKCGNKFIKKV